MKIEISHKEARVLLRAIDTLIDATEDMVDYTELIIKLKEVTKNANKNKI